MTKLRRYLLGISILAVLSAGVLLHITRDNKQPIDQYTFINRLPRIHPDYTETVIPPNIAPLNFLIEEDGSLYCAKIYSGQGQSIEIFCKTPKISIPKKPWHKLINANRGQQLYFDVFVKSKNGRWSRFSTITNKIADEDIDGFLVYRKIHPGHSNWREMGIYQRNLENFDESLILNNEYCKYGCINCHTFCANRPDKMSIAVRSRIYSNDTLLVENGLVGKIGTRFGYTSWHPSGRLATYSVNKTRQFYHSATNEVRDVIDLDSALLYYILDTETVKTSPKFSKKDRLETYPAWSPDGKYLYFCSALVLWTDRDKVPPEHYDEVRYDLLRVSYDIDTDQWGELETVLSAQDTGLSILEPRISPDGKWLLFCMCDYGSFPVYRQSSDLYLMDLQAAQKTGRYEYRRLNINSDQSESWHSFSSNSRWFAFSSKRNNYVFTRTYISYVDKAGRAYKPFLLPQKDPTFYDSCLETYSVPELITEPVRTTKEKLGRVIRSPRKIAVEMPITMATPKAGVPAGYDDLWQQRE